MTGEDVAEEGPQADVAMKAEDDPEEGSEGGIPSRCCVCPNQWLRHFAQIQDFQ